MGPAGPEGGPWKALFDKGSLTFLASSFQGVRSTMGIVIASHGTTGFLEGEEIQLSTSPVLNLHQCWGPESEGLYGVDVVPVVAGDPRQARLPQRSQLRLRERGRVGR